MSFSGDLGPGPGPGPGPGQEPVSTLHDYIIKVLDLFGLTGVLEISP